MTLRNVPAFAAALDARVDVDALGATVTYDMAYGGNFYALVPAASVGLDPVPANSEQLIAQGLAIADAINAAALPVHPLDPAIRGCKHVVFHSPGNNGAHARNATAIHPGWLDRSPCGTGTSARMAALHARGELAPGPGVRQRVGHRQPLHGTPGRGGSVGRGARRGARGDRARLDHRDGAVPARSRPIRSRPASRCRSGAAHVRVIVIGGGAVGLCVAEALSHRGCEITVFERDRCGAGASAGNAGWITPSLATPVPAPGVIATSLRWLIDPSGPLWIRPTLEPALVGWIARFVLSCRAPAYARGVAALQGAAARAPGAFDALTARGVEFEQHEDPLVFPAFGPGELEYLWRMGDELHQAGSRQRVERLSADELRALEPALSDAVIGGVIAHGERRVRPERLTAGVHRAVVARGVEVLEATPVTRTRPGRA